MALTDEEIRLLEGKARAIRETVIRMLVAAGSGHTAGPLDMADIFAAFYFHILKHDPARPDWEERDRLVLSNGHICPVLYATLAHAGYFPVEECLTLRKFGSRLQGHPERTRLTGLETTSGPLGEGLSQAAGMAWALKNFSAKGGSASGGQFSISNFKNGSELEPSAYSLAPRIYCVMSDGEQDEGNTWEAAMFAGKHRLAGLTAIMDRNNIQIDGNTEEVMPLEPLAEKYRAFNWRVLEVDGHDLDAFVGAVEEAKAVSDAPTLIIAHTTAGKGVPEIEGDYRWHGKPPSAEEGERFLAQIQRT
ncbi:transketolase [Candidatus Kaiserbacteria bacterium]|nr:transketolase [Candidatus Kaiserbacteria bacterium]